MRARAIPIFDIETEFDGLGAHELTAMLGGKAAGLVRMRRDLGLPVPSGFVIGPELSLDCLANGWPASLDAEIDRYLERLEARAGSRLGDPDSPLLVSVRSGAIEMPGMMDTILDLGIGASTLDGLARRLGSERAAVECWLRFIRMYATSVLGLSPEELDEYPQRGDSASVLRAKVEGLLRYCEVRGAPIPEDFRCQLRQAIVAVFRSSDSARARAYRRREGLAGNAGTAVIVQTMVFGNAGPRSAAGVAFSRDPSTGERRNCGEFVMDGQGMDVVSGMRTTESLDAMAGVLPSAYDALVTALERLEHLYRDMCSVEFTVERGRLYLLQVRPARRSAQAAVRVAVDLCAHEAIAIGRDEALQRVSPQQMRRLSEGEVAVDATAVPDGTGEAASPGAVVGVACFDPDEVGKMRAAGLQPILMRRLTLPDDVHGIVHAAAIVTARGGIASHAAVVARSWGVPAVCGVSQLVFGETVSIGGRSVAPGDILTVDGRNGRVLLGDHAVTGAIAPPPIGFEDICRWSNEQARQNPGARPAAEPGPIVPGWRLAPDARR
ncbi:MAG: phosphate kinase [Burkholderiaceae bacterium]|nr:phosphate kinase [Burkholderiaceae bacterium]